MEESRGISKVLTSEKRSLGRPRRRKKETIKFILKKGDEFILGQELLGSLVNAATLNLRVS